MKEKFNSEILKKMSLQEKLDLAAKLYRSAYDLRFKEFKAQFPRLSDNEIKEKVKKYFLHAK
jgi:hypothetical protein